MRQRVNMLNWLDSLVPLFCNSHQKVTWCANHSGCVSFVTAAAQMCCLSVEDRSLPQLHCVNVFLRWTKRWNVAFREIIFRRMVFIFCEWKIKNGQPLSTLLEAQVKIMRSNEKYISPATFTIYKTSSEISAKQDEQLDVLAWVLLSHFCPWLIVWWDKTVEDVHPCIVLLR